MRSPIRPRRAALFSFFCGVFLILTSCSSSPTDLEALQPQDGSREIVAILGTNDIHGALATQRLGTREFPGIRPVRYEAGGAAVLAAYVKVLKGDFGSRLIWVDAGDEFQGSIESNLAQGAPMVSFFNEAGLEGAAIGNHEFDFGVPALESRMKEARYPYLQANIHDKKTGALATFPNTLPHTIIEAGDIKIGLIGLTTLDTPRTTRARNVKDFTFTSLKKATLHEARALRAEGVNAVVLVAHVGLKCDPGRASIGLSLRKPSDPLGQCGVNDEMVRLLESLPRGTVDAVVSGHSHQIVHHWIAGVPVVQGGAFGRYFNVIYLTFDKDTRKLIPDRTRIEGPVPVCEKIFSHQGDCNGDRLAPRNGRGPLVRARFHGQLIHADAAIEALLKPTIDASARKKAQVVGQAARPIEHQRLSESELGDLVADAVRKAGDADVALVNSGGIRAPIETGPITYGEVYRSLPFDNSIMVLKVTGRQLRMILRIAESGSRGFASVSGVRLRLLDRSIDAPGNDLDHDGKIESWEQNRLLNAKLENGKPISDRSIYTLATIDFLVTGGDDLGWIMSQLPPDKIANDTGIVIRDAVIRYMASTIERFGPLNSAAHPLIDRAEPRLRFVRTKSWGRRRHARRHRR